MSLKNVLIMLNEIAETSSSNEKIELLKKHMQNELFKHVVILALDDRKHYHIKIWPPKDAKLNFKLSVETSTLTTLYDHLSLLSSKKGASNSDKRTVYAIAKGIDEETVEVVKRIVKKDLRAGFSKKSVNKALPNTLYIAPYMRCSSDKKIDNIEYPAIVQEKADGAYASCLINSKQQIKFETRNGSTIHQLANLKKIIRFGNEELEYKKTGIIDADFPDSYESMVYTGELLVRKEGKILDRKTGNGIINKCIQGTASQEDADSVVFVFWDCLPLKDFRKGKSDKVYNDRLYDCSSFAHAVNSKEHVFMVESKNVGSIEEANAFCAKMWKQDKEGAVLKNIQMPWKDGTSTQQIKMKKIVDFDLIATKWKKGKEGTKYEDCMGAVLFESSCGDLKVWVGSGFSDEQRKWDWDMLMDSIGEILCESIITSKSKGTSSLFLPRFSCIREDLSEAQSLKDMMQR